MVLIIGGAFQGKHTFVKRKRPELEENQVEDAEVCDLEQLKKASVIRHFHWAVKRWLLEGENPQLKTRELLECNPQVWIEMNELGCGVVPLEQADRMYRETAGRISCMLGAQAEAVYRITCGIERKL